MNIHQDTLQDPFEVFNNWYVETTAKTAAAAIDGGTITGNDDTRYANEKLFGLNADGMLPVEPGKYTISRINPSRYEFVANYWHYATSRNAPFHVATYDSESGSYINDNSKYRMYYGRTDDWYRNQRYCLHPVHVYCHLDGG